ncbi:MAG: hypothetical protein NZO16_01225 [Deltaproteobacteria bacterium]|nr:hypothetical protein [Deltaproteobacteria bacterium]
MFFTLPVDHLGFAINDIKELDGIAPVTLSFESMEDHGVAVATFVGESTVYEFIMPTTNESIKKFLSGKKGPIFHHICFAVENLYQFSSNRGAIHWIYEYPKIGFKKKLINFCKLRSILIEIAQDLSSAIGNKRLLVSHSVKGQVPEIKIIRPSWFSAGSWETSELVIPFVEWKFSRDQLQDFLSSFSPKEIIIDDY